MNGVMNGTVKLDTTDPSCWYIDFDGPCGTMSFRGVILVMDPTSKNPGIIIENPFGLRGLKESIALIEAERAKHGVTTLV